MMANTRTMTDKEAKHFFSGMRRDKHGRVIGADPDDERDPWDGERADDSDCALCRD
jgi:hypothetical protein